MHISGGVEGRIGGWGGGGMNFGTLRDRDTLGMHVMELGWKKDRCVRRREREGCATLEKTALNTQFSLFLQILYSSFFFRLVVHGDVLRLKTPLPTCEYYPGGEV